MMSIQKRRKMHHILTNESTSASVVWIARAMHTHTDNIPTFCLLLLWPAPIWRWPWIQSYKLHWHILVSHSVNSSISGGTGNNKHELIEWRSDLWQGEDLWSDLLTSMLKGSHEGCVCTEAKVLGLSFPPPPHSCFFSSSLCCFFPPSYCNLDREKDK